MRAISEHSVMLEKLRKKIRKRLKNSKKQEVHKVLDIPM